MRVVSLVTAAALVNGGGAFRAADAQEARTSAASSRKAAVTAVTSGLVYLGAGRTDGLQEGTVVRVARLGDRGRYRVAFLSSKSAACQGDSLAVLPEVGDSVEFVPASEAAAAVAGDGRQKSEAYRPGRPQSKAFRGRVGLRFLGSWDRTANVVLRQPGLELLLDGSVARGAPVAVAIDVRPRRTSTVRAGREATTQQVMGVYQAAVRLQGAGGPIRAIVGRQYAPTLAGVGLFDGLLLELQRPRWGAGVVGGLAPEPGTLALSSEIRQFGAYLQSRSRLQAATRWSLTAGALASYAVGGEVNREFGFAQATLSTRRVSALLLQEIDLNRAWKIAAGEARLSPTSTYLSVTASPSQWLSFSGGLDSRRNVRLYHDLTTPEAVFDDRFRRGAWAGASLTIAGKVRISGDVRTRSVEGADSLSTSSYSGTIHIDRVTPLGLGVRLRGTRYQIPGRGAGLLLAGGLRIAPLRFGAIELTAGSRREEGATSSDRTWAGLDAEIFVRRAWFWMMSYSRESGRDGLTPTTDLLYTGLSYRF
jgi:hypothetical protein